MLTPEKLVEVLDLKPLPFEGGFYRETYRAEEEIAGHCLPARYRSARNVSTAIYYLLTSDPDSFSAIHRVSSDEIFHFYLGDPVEMLLLEPSGASHRVELGGDILHGQHLQFVVPHGIWQGARVIPGGKFALLGTTVAPGFDMADFDLAVREDLVRRHPQWTDLITVLTRSPVREQEHLPKR